MTAVRIGLLCTLLLSPAAVFAQAAVQSDTPIPAGGKGTALDALPRSEGALRDTGAPNPVTGPGAPGTTGTGAAGTGPTGTMAAPGR